MLLTGPDDAHQPGVVTAQQTPSIQQVRESRSPKVALLFLVTTSVRHPELWAHWLHLAAGLHVPDDCPLPGGPAHERIAQPVPQALGYLSRVRKLINGNLSAPSKVEKEVQACLEGNSSVAIESIYASQSLFTLYLHSVPGYHQSAPSIFTGREVPFRVSTSYGGHSLIEAERALVKEALKDPTNVKFVMVAHDSIPLYPPYVVFVQLLSDGDKSRMGLDGLLAIDKNRWREGFIKNMEGMHLREQHFGKTSQWVVLTRSHAMLMDRDVHVERVFQQFCINPCVSDENYLPTLLATYNATNEKITSLRLGDSQACPWASMLDSARHTFHAWARAEVINRDRHRRIVNTTTEDAAWVPAPTMDDLGAYVRAAGYSPGTMDCALLARKFPSSTRLAVLAALFNCSGGGLASSCRHPHARLLHARHIAG
ncbi:MAG: hypothetical protein WDW38_004362 [Sanguina aurantia]